MDEKKTNWNVNILSVGIGVALIIVLTRATSVLAPQNWYFTFGALLYGYPYAVTWQAVLIKLAIPLITGLILGFFVDENPRITAGSAGFLGSFILTWPAITSWKTIMPMEMASRQGAFMIVYLFYFASFAYLAEAGTRLTRIYLDALKKHRNETKKDIIANLLDWKETMRPIIFGAVSGAISFYLGKMFIQ